MHSSSGIPDTPGQKGEQGVKMERSGGGGGPAGGFALATGRPAVTGDCLLPGVTGRIDTPGNINIKKNISYNISYC